MEIWSLIEKKRSVLARTVFLYGQSGNKVLYLQRYKQVGFHLIAFCSPLLASECFFFLSKNLPVNNRGELNDERNTSKVETTS